MSIIKLKVLVVGDAMSDVYYTGTATRLSPEAPVPVVRIDKKLTFPGGAWNVSANLQDLGCTTVYLFGGDGSGNVPQKNRLLVGETQIARWDEYDSVRSIRVESIDQWTMLSWKPDAVIVSDYGKGSISDEVIKRLGEIKDRWVFIDTKRSPTDFAGIQFKKFFPNVTEFNQYAKSFNAFPFVLKLSEKGVAEYGVGQKLVKSYPAWAESVVSVTGAGDTVIAGYVYATLAGYADPLAFANAAAAVVVEKAYTATASVGEVEGWLTKKAQKIGLTLQKSGG